MVFRPRQMIHRFTDCTPQTRMAVRDQRTAVSAPWTVVRDAVRVPDRAQAGMASR